MASTFSLESGAASSASSQSRITGSSLGGISQFTIKVPEDATPEQLQEAFRRTKGQYRRQTATNYLAEAEDLDKRIKVIKDGIQDATKDLQTHLCKAARFEKEIRDGDAELAYLLHQRALLEERGGKKSRRRGHKNRDREIQ